MPASEAGPSTKKSPRKARGASTVRRKYYKKSQKSFTRCYKQEDKEVVVEDGTGQEEVDGTGQEEVDGQVMSGNGDSSTAKGKKRAG